jgi:hypothetical protein
MIDGRWPEVEMADDAGRERWGAGINDSEGCRIIGMGHLGA